MTRRKNTAKKLNLKEIVGEQEDLLRELVQQIVQQVLEAEMDEAIGAEKGERTADRLGYRSGYYSRSLMTRVGKLELRVPQDRQGRFRTEVFERYQRPSSARLRRGHTIGLCLTRADVGCFLSRVLSALAKGGDVIARQKF